jgi:hypothetical protein
MAVHAPALMPFRHSRQTVRGLETEAVPDMDMIRLIQIGALVSCALYT